MKFPALLHSVSYAGFWGQARLSLDEFIDKAADLGFQGVMLAAKRPHLSILDFGSRERESLRRRIEQCKLEHVCVAAYNNFSFGSIHPSSTNFLYCDASTRSVSNNTALGVLLATASRDGGETQVAE